MAVINLTAHGWQMGQTVKSVIQDSKGREGWGIS